MRLVSRRFSSRAKFKWTRVLSLSFALLAAIATPIHSSFAGPDLAPSTPRVQIDVNPIAENRIEMTIASPNGQSFSFTPTIGTDGRITGIRVKGNPPLDLTAEMNAVAQAVRAAQNYETQSINPEILDQLLQPQITRITERIEAAFPQANSVAPSAAPAVAVTAASNPPGISDATGSIQSPVTWAQIAEGHPYLQLAIKAASTSADYAKNKIDKVKTSTLNGAIVSAYEIPALVATFAIAVNVAVHLGMPFATDLTNVELLIVYSHVAAYIVEAYTGVVAVRAILKRIFPRLLERKDWFYDSGFGKLEKRANEIKPDVVNACMRMFGAKK
jgi:hypothetical protein